MIEFTETQVSAMESQQVPLNLVDPETQEVYVLIRKSVYDLTCGIVGGGTRRVWADDADDDLLAERASDGGDPVNTLS